VSLIHDVIDHIEPINASSNVIGVCDDADINIRRANGRLKLLLRERLARIDELTAKVDQLRAANQKLDAEANHLAALVRMS
jgi:hypothetical protein